MQIIGDRHYTAAAGERVTFAAGAGVHVGSVMTDHGPLPVTVVGGTHHSIMVTVGFTSQAGGSLIVTVSDADGIADTSKIRQLATLPTRSAPFIVD
jgi:hypothetical protein